MAEQTTAYLSNRSEYTTFSFSGRSITFLTSKSLERYTSVKEWDNGYLVVIAKHFNRPTEEEEYIDLVPILENLYMNAKEFLSHIKQVELKYSEKESHG